jgi:hypothetical protein
MHLLQLLKPSALIGVSTNPDCFTEEIIKLMTATNSRPIIFPLSNPTRKSECTFAAAVQHSDGKVLCSPQPHTLSRLFSRFLRRALRAGSFRIWLALRRLHSRRRDAAPRPGQQRLHLPR